MPTDLLRSGTRRAGIVLLCAKVALVPLAFDAASDQSFTLPKALLSHGLSYALVVVLVALLVQFRRSVIVASPIHLPVLAFLGANIAATIFATDPRLALFGAHGRMLGLGTLIDWTVLYFAFVLLVRTRDEILAVFAWAVMVTPVVVLYEYIQGAGRDPFSWTTANTERPFSTFGLSTALGEYLVILAAALVTFAVFVEGLRRWQRASIGMWAAVLLVAAARTGTRSIVLGAAAAIIVVGAAAWLRTATRRGRVVVLVAAAASALVLGVVIFATPLGQRVTSTFIGGGGGDIQVDPSTSGRLDLYRIAYGMFTERPLLGYGPDSFAAGVPRYRPDPADTLVRQSLATSGHGWIPYIATGSGTLGLLAFAAILVVAALVLVRGRAPAFALVGAAMAATFLGAGLTSVDDISVDWLFWLGLGLIAAATAVPTTTVEPQAQRGKGGGRRARRAAPAYRPPRWLGSITALAVLVALLAIAPGWNASRSAKRSTDLRLTRQVRPAIDAGMRAVQEDGGRAEYWHTLAFAYIANQQWRDARDALAHAISLQPYDVLHLGDAVSVELSLAAAGDGAASQRAVALSQQAVSMDPNNPRAQLLRATTLEAVGNTTDAEPYVRRALSLDPGSQNELLYVTAVRVLTANAHVDEAIAIGRDGINYMPPNAVGLRFELARTLVSANQPQEALALLDYILSVNPNLTAAQQLRAQVRASLP